MQSILPKSVEEFEQKEYWDKFFRKLKKNSDMEYFEWYGEYVDFKAPLKKYIKSSDKILNIGCGKSLMSEQMYDEGFENIINCDFSEKVIEGKHTIFVKILEMNARSKSKRPKMEYHVMDVMKMTYENGAFDAVLDKGINH
jgi:2-polyprenyl-3-methyl-5-hydroxy-6-metoxy-1,4-benzoquinol methylase